MHLEDRVKGGGGYCANMRPQFELREWAGGLGGGGGWVRTASSSKPLNQKLTEIDAKASLALLLASLGLSVVIGDVAASRGEGGHRAWM